MVFDKTYAEEDSDIFKQSTETLLEAERVVYLENLGKICQRRKQNQV